MDENKPISVRLPVKHFATLHQVLDEITIKGKQARFVVDTQDAIDKALSKAMEK